MAPKHQSSAALNAAAVEGSLSVKRMKWPLHMVAHPPSILQSAPPVASSRRQGEGVPCPWRTLLEPRDSHRSQAQLPIARHGNGPGALQPFRLGWKKVPGGSFSLPGSCGPFFSYWSGGSCSLPEPFSCAGGSFSLPDLFSCAGGSFSLPDLFSFFFELFCKTHYGGRDAKALGQRCQRLNWSPNRQANESSQSCNHLGNMRCG